MDHHRTVIGQRRERLCGRAVLIATGLAVASIYPAAAQPGAAFVVARGATAPITLSVAPNARCQLSAMNPRGGRPLTAFSNARGLVRYFLTMRADARSGALASVECWSATSHTVTGITITPGALAARPTLPAVQRPTIAALQTNATAGVLPGTPPGFDVTRATDAQLARLGYPPRPDAQLHPFAYTLWRKLVTTPGAYVPPGVVDDPERRGPSPRGQVRPMGHAIANATGYGVTTSPNWSGSVVIGQPKPFDEVYGTWNVPSVSTDGYVGGAYSSTWVGIDGFGSGDVVQDGTAQDAFNYVFVSWASYHAWYEFYPDNEKALSNVSVSPGDPIFAVTWTNYVNGRATGYFYLYDYASGQGSSASEAVPANATFSGASVEWIVERPSINGSVTPLPDYGGLQMGSAAAITTDGNYYGTDGSNSFNANDTHYNVIMTSNGGWSGDWLSLGYFLDSRDVAFKFYHLL